MGYDDGKGLYTYCKRGRSHCTDQTCDCVDSAHYRTLYIMARERNGWYDPHITPSKFKFATLWTLYTLAGFLAATVILGVLYVLTSTAF